MRVFLPLTILTVLMAPAIENAQDARLKQLQKQIENALFKHTPTVKSARFDNCRLTLKVTGPFDGSFDPIAGRVPTVSPTEGVLSATVGSGGSYESKTETKYEINFDHIDGDTISSEAISGTEFAQVTLHGPTDEAVTMKTERRIKYLQRIDIKVDSKVSGQTANDFRKVAKLCKKPH